jgi:hypothetical protein
VATPEQLLFKYIHKLKNILTEGWIATGRANTDALQALARKYHVIRLKTQLN